MRGNVTDGLKNICVTAADPELVSSGQKLAADINAPFHININNESASAFDYLLVLTPQFLGLQKPGDKKPFYPDFLSGKIQHRSQHAGLRREWLARAMGVKPAENPVIVDATAGWGRDSFILASLGYRVTMLERSPVVYHLLKDAMERAHQDMHLKPVIERMHLINQDACDWLSTGNTADIIYLDPMFPHRQKSASVKKEMVILQEILETCQDQERLFQLALTCAGRRVVVKRPRLAANIGVIPPNFQLTGKSSRFDVYLTQTS